MVEYVKYTPSTAARAYTPDIFFYSEIEARMVLDALKFDITAFGRTSVSHFYDLCMIPSSEEEKTLGWDEDAFSKARVVRGRGIYEIEFPEPVTIEALPEVVMLWSDNR